ncbi:MAG TPA: glycoside hydrolase family 9 protein [Polyangiaceae bacterium]
MANRSIGGSRSEGLQLLFAAGMMSGVVACSSAQSSTSAPEVGGARTNGGVGGSGASASNPAGGAVTGGRTATTTSGDVTASGGRSAGGSSSVAVGGVGGTSMATTALGGARSSVGGVTSAGGATQTSNNAGGVMTTGGASALGGTRAAGGTTATVSSGVLGGAGTSAAGSSPSTSVASSADKPSTDTTWSQGLTAGANGPIPFIVVDQFGYRTGAKKVAVIRDPQTGYDSAVSFTPGTHYSVVNKATGATVKQGEPAAWNGGATDSSSGDKAWWFDFSDVTAPGTYTVVDVDKNVRSVEFEIDDNVYRSVLKHAVRMYYYQRVGFAKSAATVGGDWADGASHLGAGQDSQAHAWTAKTDAALVKDLRGGWFDAGDYNKYTAWAAGTVIALLHAYQENPTAFGDDYGIAESGNGIPDILDEAKWSLDWLVRMQNADGSLLCVMGLGGGSPPSAATDPSYYGPATTNASLAGAAVFAYASKIYGARPEANLKTFATDLGTRAAKAWTWAVANPSVIYHNNDESKQAGSSGLAAGDQETDDSGRLTSKFQASVHLYDLTGEATYRSFAEANWNQVLASSGPTEWDMERADAVVYFARLNGVTASVSTAIVNQVTTNIASQLAAMAGSSKDPYRAHLANYTWSSNQIKMAQARLFQYLAKLGSGSNAESAVAAAEDYVHYLHGVNPLGLVYLTNMKRAGAENSAKTMFHTWFADHSSKWDEVSSSTPGPAPGFVVGGPNTSFSLDGCCTAPSGDAAYHCYGSSDYSLCSQNWQPPMGQPSQKSYLQFNSGWPAGSWSITEPSTGYEAKYVLVLSAYAR